MIVQELLDIAMMKAVSVEEKKTKEDTSAGGSTGSASSSSGSKEPWIPKDATEAMTTLQQTVVDEKKTGSDNEELTH